jgi:hypothetical protein
LLCHYSLGTILHGLADQQEKVRIINENQQVRKPFASCQEYFFQSRKNGWNGQGISLFSGEIHQVLLERIFSAKAWAESGLLKK